ncbi:F-UL15B protein [Chelonid alphaherpesvirus 5]|uniref:F-UL15B protein n=1 Tax=Chelonid alphaherpesvirus 5 TaxID=702736 RepID=V5NYQ5_9ALPH|nr:F-UL15B protein [Chelonid alphaherpesvirus 5]AHA93338.1 F-UL15B protein [Chelonid alphaherpesvirus 5]
MGFLNQANCKVIFVSSVNTGKASTSLLMNLRDSSEGLLNLVTYICDDHMRDVISHRDAAVCSCYVFQKPVFVAMDSSVRRTADLFLKESFMNEIIGGRTTVPGENTVVPIFSERATDEFLIYRPSTVDSRNLDSVLFVYVDPAYTNNQKASGTGVAVIGRLLNAPETLVVFGLEHFFLASLTGEACEAIAECVSACVASVWLTHGRRFAEVRVAVEGNSSQDSAVAIACRVNRFLSDTSLKRTFYHSKGPEEGADLAPYYMLNKDKSPAFEYFVAAFNSGRIVLSQELISNTVRLTVDPADYLLGQLHNLSETLNSAGLKTYSAKKGSAADDMLVAAVMAAYMTQLKRPPFHELPL